MAIVAEIRQHLNRVGCRTDRTEPTWGPADQAALERFHRHTGARFTFARLGPEIAQTIALFKQQVCPHDKL